MEFETSRLLIRPIQLRDKEPIFKYRSDSITNKYQGWIPYSLEDVEYFIGTISTEPNIPDTWYQLVIIEHETQKLIGDIGIHFMDTVNRQVELGFTLSKDFQGKGYATEALRKVIEYLFVKMEKHRIIASLDPANINSTKLLERLGFRKEAHFVESLYLNGKWVDDLVYALLAREWKASY